MSGFGSWQPPLGLARLVTPIPLTSNLQIRPLRAAAGIQPRVLRAPAHRSSALVCPSASTYSLPTALCLAAVLETLQITTPSCATGTCT